MIRVGLCMAASKAVKLLEIVGFFRNDIKNRIVYQLIDVAAETNWKAYNIIIHKLKNKSELDLLIQVQSNLRQLNHPILWSSPPDMDHVFQNRSDNMLFLKSFAN